MLGALFIFASLTPTSLSAESELLSPRDAWAAEHDTRTISSIVLSSLFTLFSWVYFCVRPDIPSPHDSPLQILTTKLNIVTWALISPELVAFWAFKQWFEAGKIAKEYKDRGWTRKHGLFLIMGGFMLYSDDRPVQTISIQRMRQLLRRGAIDFPSTSSADIENRKTLHSALTALILLQVGWFAVQCISRLAKGLLITQLEAVVMTLVITNSFILLFAWHKPLDALQPVRLNVNFDLRRLVPAHGIHPTIKDDFKRESNMTETLRHRFLEERQLYNYLPPPIQRFVNQFLKILFIWPIRSAFKDFGRLAINVPPSIVSDGALNVPLFYAPDSGDLLQFILPVAILLGMGSGAVHCLFWSWGYFPSQEARLVWRVCSLTTAGFYAVSLILIVVIALTQLWNQFAFNRVIDFIGDVFIYSGICLFMVTFIPFILSRILLLVESFVCLKSLPASGLQIVSWTNFIPHFA